ncbi:MAG: hypothetical protein Q8Q49_00840 [bacterium]|nr:hypothetical protein [bacterium]
MNYKTKLHLWYYSGLLVVLISCLVLVFQSLHDINLIMGITVFMSVFYVSWAILHHYVHHDVHAKVVIEYVLIGMLGISVVYFTLFLLK